MNNELILSQPFVQGFIQMGSDGFARGWHERNGGNLSYRIKAEELAPIVEALDMQGAWQPVGARVPGLAGEYFLVTGSGQYFRHLEDQPAEALGIIRLDENGENYQIIFGFEKGGRPTSELPSHLMNLEVKKALDPDYRVVYHAHTTNLIALTYVLPLDDAVFTRELWEMATECPVVFPQGIGVVEWMVPGSLEIAAATAKKMEDYDLAIWAHHGVFAAGRDFDLTFGLMHTAEKAAEILVKVLSMAPMKKQTIQKDELIRVADAFGVSLFKSALRISQSAPIRP